MRKTLFPILVFVPLAFAGGCARKTSAAPPAPAPNPALAKGQAVYIKYCATCHGPAGNGYVADNAPSLRSPTFLATATDSFLQAAIMRGRPGTAMGAYARAVGGPLAVDEVDAVIAFLREGGPPREWLAQPLTVGDAKRGEPLYMTMCARCHGTKTQRISAVHLANPVFLETASVAFLRHAVEVGRPPTSMIPWKDTLKTQQIADVVAYVKSMAPTPAGVPAAVLADVPAPPTALPRKGPVVLNPKGRAPDFTLKDDLYVSIDQVKAALDQKRRLVIGDARAPSEWASLHITGAISTPYYDAKALDDIPNDGTWVLAYCACPHHVSGEVVAALRKLGYKHTAVIDEGIYAWKQKGYPVVEAPNLPPIAAPPPLHAAPAPTIPAAPPVPPPKR